MPPRRLPIWAVVLIAIAVIAHAVRASVHAFPAFLVAGTTIAAFLSAFYLAAWLEERIYLGLRERAGAIRLLASVGLPVLGLIIGVPLAVAFDLLPEKVGFGGWFGTLSFATSFWFAGAATGSIVLLIIDLVVSRVVPRFRGRIVLAVLLLLTLAYGISLLIAARALELLELLRSGAGGTSIQVRFGGQERATELLGLFSRRPFLLVSSAFGLSAVLGLPAVVSACSKLADSVMERIHPLAAGFELLAKGERAIRVEEGGSRDFAQLAAEFNQMVSSLTLARAFGNYVSSQFLDRIRAQHGEAVIAPTQREASVLFADIRGFTALAETLPPDAVLSVLNRYFEAVVATVAEHEGYVDKFMGDAAFVVFNGPIDQADHAGRATACGIALQRKVAALNAENAFPEMPNGLRVGVGIATGPLVCGTVGTDRVEYAMVGDTVNLAARFLSHAEAGEVWVSERTARGLPEGIPLEPLSTIQVKGKMFPIVPYRAWPRR